MSADNINISFHQNTNVDLVKDFYRIKTDYRNFETVKRTDRTIISADKEIVIGVLRLCEENGIDILRGFNVQNEYQKKGIGLSMLIEAEKYMLERTCYLICKETLNSLYEKVGFYQTSEVPEFLKERMLSYNNDKLNILKRRVGIDKIKSKTNYSMIANTKSTAVYGKVRKVLEIKQNVYTGTII